MTHDQFAAFSAFRDKFRAQVAAWSADAGLMEALASLQKQAADADGVPAYPLETPIVYNTALDAITEDDDIRLIVIGDNPGKSEQLATNRKYLVGQAGKIAEGFFRRNPELGIDFRKNAIILNKTPLHTAKTRELAMFADKASSASKAGGVNKANVAPSAGGATQADAADKAGDDKQADAAYKATGPSAFKASSNKQAALVDKAGVAANDQSVVDASREPSFSQKQRLATLLDETQRFMARETAALQKALDTPQSPCAIWLVGYAELKPRGLFTTYRDILADEYRARPESELYVYQHFSMNCFTTDLKKRADPERSLAENLRVIGCEHRKEIFGF